MKIGVIGIGFVGSALSNVFKEKGAEVIVYDKYKNLGSFEDILSTNLVFLCLPTPYVGGHGYDLSAIQSVCESLSHHYRGLVLLKSTVEPGTTRKLAKRWGLKIAHNPEFLTARTAEEDFRSQKHIVLGCNELPHLTQGLLTGLYRGYFPDAELSICSSVESETMKLFVNNFYAMKVGIFNEFNLLCQKLMIDYNLVVGMMLQNGWIAPHHIQVPGPDGKRGWGGDCFLKDSKALLQFMQSHHSPAEILAAAIEENKKIRS